MKKRGLLALLFGMAVMSFTILNSCDIDIGLGSAVDTEPPVLKIENPPSLAIIRDSFKISGSWSDDGEISGITAVLRNTETSQEFSSLTGELGKEDDWSIIIDPIKSKIPDGKYEATITMIDNAKHRTSISRSFYIDNNAPVVVLQRPSSKVSDSVIDLYGQTFSLTGQAADDNNIAEIHVNFYRSPECTGEPFHQVIKNNIPPTISLDIAKFVENEYNDYAKIYDSVKKVGKSEPVYCTIVAYDSAKRYPITEADAKEDDKLGNHSESYYLYDDIYYEILSSYKVTELYSIISGTFTSDDASRVAETKSIPETLKSYEVKAAKFQLNPANNPEYKVVGRDGLKKDGTDFVNVDNTTNSENDLSNESNITVKVDVGLDAIPLKVDTLKVYLLPCDAKGETSVEDKPENRIYPNPSVPPYEKNGTGYTFTTKIAKNACKYKDGRPVSLTIGNYYIIALEGFDSNGNEAVPESDDEGNKKTFGFRLAPNGAAPILNVKTSVNRGDYTDDSMVYVPRYNPENISQLTKLKFQGTVSLEDGEPKVEFSLDGKEREELSITPTGNKGEFAFDTEVEVSAFVDSEKSGQHSIVFYANQTQDATPIKKTLMYQVDAPKVTLSRAEPTAYNYYYGEEGALVESGKAEFITVENKEVTKKYINGKNVTLPVTIIAGAVGLEEKDEKRPKIEFIQNGQVKAIMDAPTFDNTDPIDTTQFEEGELLIKITAYDLAGNKGEATETYYVNQATDIPVILPKNSSNSSVSMTLNQAESLENTSINIYSANQTVGYRLIDDDGLAEASYVIRKPASSDPNPVDEDTLKTLSGSIDYQLDLKMPEAAGTYFISITTKDILQNQRTKSFYIRVTAAAPVIDSIQLQNTIAKGTDSINPVVKVKSDQAPFTLERVIKKVTGTDFSAYPIVSEYTNTYTWNGANGSTEVTSLNTKNPIITDTIDLSNISVSSDYVITYKITDKNGKSVEGTKDITVDINAPNITEVKVAGSDYDAAKWYNSKTLALAVTAADITNETGISAVEYSINGNVWTALSYNNTSAAYEGSAVFSTEGPSNALYIRARDMAGNVTYFDGTSENGTQNISSGIPSVNVQIDTSAPVLSLSSYKVGELASVSEITSSKLYVKDGVTLKLSGTYKDDQSVINNNTLAFEFGTMPDPVVTKDDSTTPPSWAATWTIDKTKTLGSLTIKVQNNAGIETSVTPFDVILDNEYPILKNISLSTNSTNTEIYKKSDTEYYVNNKKPFGSSNATPEFTISGISTDNTGVAQVSLYEGSTKVRETTASDFSFTALDWKNKTGSITLTIKATDIAGNENSDTLPSGLDQKYKPFSFTVYFDTTGPVGLHQNDLSHKDIYFRIGDQDRDDGVEKDSENNIITDSTTGKPIAVSGQPVWNSVLDENVGGKYKVDTFGNNTTITIRGNISDSESGVDMIYYKVYHSLTEVTEKTDEQLISDVVAEKLYFAPLGQNDIKRVYYNSGANHNDSIENTYKTTISKFTEGKNFLVLVAKDKVGNYSIDTPLNSSDTAIKYYSMNVDTTAPVITKTTNKDILYSDGGTFNVDVNVIDPKTKDLNNNEIENSSSGIKTVILSTTRGNVTCSLKSGTTSTYTADIKDILEDEKSLTVTAVAKDGAGSSSSLIVANVMVDKTSPNVSIITPSTGVKTNTLISLNGSVNDGTGAGIKESEKVTLYYTTDSSLGNSVPTASTIESWTAYETKMTLNGQSWSGNFTVPDSVAADNNNTTLYLSAGAIDNAGIDSARTGNAGYSTPVTVVVDRKAPVSSTLNIDEISGTLLGENTTNWFNNTTVSLSGSYTDLGGSGVKSVKYAIKKAGASDYAAEKTIASDGNYTENIKDFIAGTNTIKVWAVDTCGNETSPVEYTVKIDDRAPSISAEYTGVIYSDSASCPVELTVTDLGDSTIDKVSLTVGENDPVDCKFVNGKYRYDIESLLVDGTASVTATATDKAGNTTSRVIANVMKDTTGPSVEINTPVDNAKTASTISVSGSASDGTGSGVNTTKGITLYYTSSSTVKANAPTSSTISSDVSDVASMWVKYENLLSFAGQSWNGTFNVPASVAANNVNTTLYLCAGAVDKSGNGNHGYSTPVALVVDRKAPVQTEFNVDEEDADNLGENTTVWFKNTTVNLNGTFTDEGGSGVSKIWYQVKKQDETAYGTASSVASDGEFSFNVKDLKEGINKIKIWAEDGVGNPSSDEAEYIVKIDSKLPEVVSEGGMQYSDGSACNISFTVKDEGTSSGLAKVELTSDKVATKIEITSGLTSGEVSLTQNVQSLLPANGMASITATVYDKAGNSNSKVVGTVMKDTDGPTVKISSTTSKKDKVTLVGTADDGTGRGIRKSAGLVLYYAKTSSAPSKPTAATIGEGKTWKQLATKEIITGDAVQSSLDWSWEIDVSDELGADNNNTDVYFSVMATDDSGIGNKGYSDAKKVTIDRKEPEFSSLTVGEKTGSAIENFWYKADTLRVSASFTDEGGSGVKTVKCKIGDAGDEQEVPSSGLNLSGFEEGNNILYVWAEDEAGNKSADTSYTVKVDTTLPQVTSKQSGNVYSNGGAYTISVDVSESSSGIKEVVFSAPGKTDIKVTSPATGTTTYSADVQSLLSSSGSTTITATAYDNAGNQGKETAAKVTIDKHEPVLAIKTPSDNTSYSGTRVILSGTADDGTGAGLDADEKITLYYTTKVPTELTQEHTAYEENEASVIPDTTKGWLAYGTKITAAASWTVTFDTTDITTADNNKAVYFAIGAKDKSGTGNQGYSEPRMVTVDCEKPAFVSITIDNKDPSTAWFTNETLNINGSFTDAGSKVKTIWYKVKKQGAESYGARKSIATTTGDFNTNIEDFAEGINYITIWAEDNVENASTETIYTVRVDKNDPNITSNYTETIPTKGSKGDACSITVSVSDPGTIGNSGIKSVIFSRDGKATTISAPESNGSYSADIKSILGTTSGTFTINATAEDYAGRKTTKPVAMVMVDTDGPTVAITSPTASSTVNGAISLKATSEDNVGGTGLKVDSDTEKSFNLYYTTDSALGAKDGTTEEKTITSSDIGASADSKFKLIKSITNAASVTFTQIDTTKLDGSNATSGNVYFMVSSSDKAGNVGYSKPILATIDQDTDRPVIKLNAITLPTAMSAISNVNYENSEISGTISDDDGFPSELCYSTNGSTWTTDNLTYSSSDGSFSLSLDDGKNQTIYFKVTNTAEYEGQTAKTFETKVFTTTPSNVALLATPKLTDKAGTKYGYKDSAATAKNTVLYMTIDTSAPETKDFKYKLTSGSTWQSAISSEQFGGTNNTIDIQQYAYDVVGVQKVYLSLPVHSSDGTSTAITAWSYTDSNRKKKTYYTSGNKPTTDTKCYEDYASMTGTGETITAVGTNFGSITVDGNEYSREAYIFPMIKTETSDEQDFDLWQTASSSPVNVSNLASSNRVASIITFDGTKQTKDTVSITVDNTAPVARVTSHAEDDQIGAAFLLKGGFTNSDAPNTLKYILSTSATAPATNSTDWNSRPEVAAVTSMNWTIFFDGADSSTTETHASMPKGIVAELLANVIISETGANQGKAVYKEAENGHAAGDLYRTITPVYFHLLSVDPIGNKSVSTTKLRLDPQGDIPKIEMSYPFVSNKAEDVVPGTSIHIAKLSGTIRAQGSAEDDKNIVGIYMQIDPVFTKNAQNQYVFNSNWDTVACVNGRTLAQNGYIIEDMYTSYNDFKNLSSGDTGYKTNGPKGIKVGTTPSWNISLNANGEFNKANDLNYIAIKFYAVDEDGNISVWDETKDPVVVSIDSDAPKFGSSEPFYLYQYGFEETSTGKVYYANKKTPSTGDQLYSDPGCNTPVTGKTYPENGTGYTSAITSIQYADNMWLNGEWWLVGSVEDENDISELKINAVDVMSSFETKDWTSTHGYLLNYKIGNNTADSYGSISYKIIAKDNSEDQTSGEYTINIKYDNKMPSLAATTDDDFNIPTDVKNDNGFYKVQSVVTEADGESGFDKVFFYFKRGTNIFDAYMPKENDANKPSNLVEDSNIFWKTNAVTKVEGKNITVTADANIHKGGLVKVFGSIYTIKDITGNGTVITLSGNPPALAANTTETAYFAIGHVVDHAGTETEGKKANKYKGNVYGNGYFRDSPDDDGDLMLEKVSTGSTKTLWYGCINSRNIPDGTIEIHYVAFDKAGNMSHGAVTNAAISNNAPRLAGLTVWTDYNGDGVEDAAEKDSKYYTSKPRKIDGEYIQRATALTSDLYVTGNGKEVEDGATQFMRVTDTIRFYPEIIGGNGDLYYSYKIGTGNDSTKWGTDTNGKAGNSGTTKFSTITRKEYSDEAADYMVEDENLESYINGADSTGKLDSIEVPATTTVTDGLSLANLGDGLTWFEYTIWDSTEDKKPFDATGKQINTTLSAKFTVLLNITYQDSQKPVATISPFYWNSKSDNSVKWNNDEPLGHIELEDDLSDELISTFGDTASLKKPKVSGTIVVRGTAYDDVRLGSLWAQFTGQKGLNTAKEIATFSNGKWTENSNAADGWSAKVEPVSFGSDGHFIKWTLEIDTAKVSTDSDVVGMNRVLEVYAKDARGNNGDGNQSASSSEQTVNPSYTWSEVKGTTDLEKEAALKTYYLDKEFTQKVTAETADTTKVYRPYNTSATWSAVSSQTEAKDKYFTDMKCTTPASALTPGTATVYTSIKTPYYKMDVVPYITGVTTALKSKLKTSIVDAYTRTTLGNYIVRDNETVTFNGYNLAGAEYVKAKGTGNTDDTLVTLTGTNTNQLAISNVTASSSIMLKVGDLYTINNMNNNNAKGAYTGTISDISSYSDLSNYAYNRMPNNRGNNLLTDDVYFDVWQFVAKAGEPVSGELREPVVKVNPVTGKLGFAFVSGPADFSMPDGHDTHDDDVTYTVFQHNYATFSNVSMCYDELGYSYAVVTGLDTYPNGNTSTYAGRFTFQTSRWGVSSTTDRDDNYNGTKKIRLEAIGLPGDSRCYVKGLYPSSYTMTETRFYSPSIVATNHGNDTSVYLAYYDSVQNQIRFRYGNTVPGTKQNFSNFQDNTGLGTVNSQSNGDDRKHVFEANTNAFSLIAGSDWQGPKTTADEANGYTKHIGTNYFYDTGYGAAKYVAIDAIPGEAYAEDTAPVVNDTTASGTRAKTATIPNFTVETGAYFYMTFTNNVQRGRNTAATLDVNNTGAKEIYRNNTALTQSQDIGKGPFKVTYTGTYWNFEESALPTVTYNDIVVAVWYDGKDCRYAYTTNPASGKDNGIAGGWIGNKVIFSDGGEHCAIKIGPDGSIHIAANVDGALKYAYLSSYDAGYDEATDAVTVDSYAITGEKITIDVGRKAFTSGGTTTYKVVPYISYYMNSAKLPALASLVIPSNGTMNYKAQGTDASNNFTGKWEISIVPTQETLTDLAVDKINVALWKKTVGTGNSAVAGVITGCTDTVFKSASQGWGRGDNGNNHYFSGNGTQNPAIGYAIVTDSGTALSIAQKK